MNLAETLELLRGLRASGATHFKSADFEVTLSSVSPVSEGGLAQEVPPAPITPPPIQNDDATEKLKELIGTLKLDDETLVDKIFPDGAGGPLDGI